MKGVISEEGGVQEGGSVTLDDLRKKMAEFARERDWDQFHSPRNLLLALVFFSLTLNVYFLSSLIPFPCVFTHHPLQWNGKFSFILSLLMLLLVFFLAFSLLGMFCLEGNGMGCIILPPKINLFFFSTGRVGMGE